VNDPDLSRVGFAMPEWASLGQLASWAKKGFGHLFKQNF
jgi:hypothetical protein